ncbi:MAG TPA: YqaJ viral recombinase family protein, partial [Candidatus Binataceae bacterium]
ANIITPKGAPTTGERRRKYMCRLIAERLLDYAMTDKFETEWTLRGKELEPQAAIAFARKFDCELADGAFITNGIEIEISGTPAYTGDDSVGASPDRVIGGLRMTGRQGLEIKCPAPWTQIDYLLNGPGADYKQQVQGQLLVGEFEAMHFWAFHPQMPAFHTKTTRDEAYLALLARELYYFCAELDEATERVRRMGTFVPGQAVVEIPGVFPWADEQTMQ